jgi:hypothetical protein
VRRPARITTIVSSLPAPAIPNALPAANRKKSRPPGRRKERPNERLT